MIKKTYNQQFYRMFLLAHILLAKRLSIPDIIINHYVFYILVNKKIPFNFLELIINDIFGQPNWLTNTMCENL
jgi:hypothetical protein